MEKEVLLETTPKKEMRQHPNLIFCWLVEVLVWRMPLHAVEDGIPGKEGSKGAWTTKQKEKDIENGVGTVELDT